MNKFFSFLAGSISGIVVGAVVVLLVTPASGEELLEAAEQRVTLARSEARRAMEERRLELEQQFQSARHS